MGKVYVLAGFLTVITCAGLAWLILAKVGQKMFKKREKR